MEWFTTNEAAEALKISSTRVRQLVQKHKSNKELVKSTKKKTRTIYSVSTKFIEVCQTNRATLRQPLKSRGTNRATKWNHY
jgi:DNA-binding transcriptional regulator GbsR (MarR family)